DAGAERPEPDAERERDRLAGLRHVPRRGSDESGKHVPPCGRGCEGVPVQARENQAGQGRREAEYEIVFGRLRTRACAGLQPPGRTTVLATTSTNARARSPSRCRWQRERRR